jgi:hypothetical protein
VNGADIGLIYAVGVLPMAALFASLFWRANVDDVRAWPSLRNDLKSTAVTIGMCCGCMWPLSLPVAVIVGMCYVLRPLFRRLDRLLFPE